MTDPDLDRDLAALKNARSLEPSPGAAERALDAAMSAFESRQSEKSRRAVKGTAAGRRQVSASPSWAWRLIMQNRMAIGGAAACLVAVPLAAVLYAERDGVRVPTTWTEARQDVAAPAKTEPGTTVSVETGPAKTAPEPQREADAAKRDFDRALAYRNEPVGGAPATPQQNLAAGMQPEPTGRLEAQAAAKSRAAAQDSIGGALSRPMAAPPPSTVAPAPRIAAARPAMEVAAMQEAARDRFEAKAANGVKVTAQEPVSTFSIDADTASYSWVRRALKEGRLPGADEVRVEELVNYFPYDYAKPDSADAPFRPTVAVTPTPWNASTKLVHIGIKGFDPAPTARPKANLVFLIDTSGSMESPDKLPLVKTSLKLLLGRLAPDDHVAIVTYAGEAGVALQPTRASDAETIKAAIDRLGAGGSTAGAAGIAEAYRLAKKNFDPKGVNRVLLATDGDFNVGVSDDGGLQKLIEKQRKSGVYLSVLGFGEGNYNDAAMQRLAQNGNGTAAYIDELDEAQKTLVEEAGATLFPIAKDAKIQVEFNPAQVSQYRLVGYETRMLNREDFNDDTVDAGEVGSGAAVTALYEITPVGAGAKPVDDLRYAPPSAARPVEAAKPADGKGGEYGFLKIRYKLPNEDRSRLIEQPIGPAQESDLSKASDDVRFAGAVAAFGQKLRGEKQLDGMGWDEVAGLADGARGADKWGYRAGFVRLVGLAGALSKE